MSRIIFYVPFAIVVLGILIFTILKIAVNYLIKLDPERRDPELEKFIKSLQERYGKKAYPMNKRYYDDKD